MSDLTAEYWWHGRGAITRSRAALAHIEQEKANGSR